MRNQNRPSSKKHSPDTASTYERGKPEKEVGFGNLDDDKAKPHDSPDRIGDAVHNQPKAQRQINSDNRDVQHGASINPPPAKHSTHS